MRHERQRCSKALYSASGYKKYDLRPRGQLSEFIGFGERFRQARADHEYIDGVTSVEALRRDCGSIGFNKFNIQICAIGRECTT